MERDVKITTNEEHILALIRKAHQGDIVRVIGIGNSMRPLLKDGRDYIDLVEVDAHMHLQKNDVIFYKSHENTYVLHRIHSISREGYYPLGDGNVTVEPLIERENIFLKAIGFLRNGHYICVDSKRYHCYVLIWNSLLPFRTKIFRWSNRMSKLTSLIKKEK